MNMNVCNPLQGTLSHALMQPHPNDLPDLYALICDGDCMEPLYQSGQPLLFSRVETCKPGDVVAIYRAPRSVAPGENPVLLKRLISSPPACFFNKPRDIYGRPKGALQGKVIARMLNPDKSLIIGTEDVLGIHKCLGALGPHDVLSGVV